MAIYTNTDVRLRFSLSLRKADVAVSLVGATLRMTIKRTVDDADPVLVLEANECIEVVDAKRGIFEIHFSAADTSNMGVGAFVFDIIRTDGGDRAPIVCGSFKIEKGVS